MVSGLVWTQRGRHGRIGQGDTAHRTSVRIHPRMPLPTKAGRSTLANAEISLTSLVAPYCIRLYVCRMRVQQHPGIPVWPSLRIQRYAGKVGINAGANSSRGRQTLPCLVAALCVSVSERCMPLGLRPGESRTERRENWERLELSAARAADSGSRGEAESWKKETRTVITFERDVRARISRRNWSETEKALWIMFNE
ncbi:hypothetical protein LX36DRAFT_408012 [Colletotrichum falcatum]|nr:hypothetical protein LX36DRAFT_408012 [Colletotrichum falcatum]